MTIRHRTLLQWVLLTYELKYIHIIINVVYALSSKMSCLGPQILSKVRLDELVYDHRPELRLRVREIHAKRTVVEAAALEIEFTIISTAETT